MFHLYFLMFLHRLLDFRCFWVQALVQGVTSLIGLGLQASQQKKQDELAKKQLEQQQKTLDFETKKYNDTQNAQKKAGQISESAINEINPSQSTGISGTIGSISDISGGSSLGLNNKETSFLRS